MTAVRTLAYILGGGSGKRLYPLTIDRAKPAVPFGGAFRVIDFVLSNLYHSQIRKICILTQYESESLHKHIKYGWYPRFGIGSEEFITALPAAQGRNGGWYLGTANAVYQKRQLINQESPDIVNIFSADHIYLMDVSQMNDFHIKNNADLTISAVPMKKSIAANNLGVLQVDKNYRLIGFEEKPSNPKPIPGNEEYCLASMGNYAFNPQVLLNELENDTNKKTLMKTPDSPVDRDKFTSNDIALDIIHSMIKNKKKIFVYNFMNNKVPGTNGKEVGFWRDIGTIDSYYEAHMDLIKKEPLLNLYNKFWNILTYIEVVQPARIVDGGNVSESIIANGVIIEGGNIEKSVLSYDIKIQKGSSIKESILLGENIIGKNVKINKSIIEKKVNIPDNETVGIDRKKDESRGFTVTNSGITIIPKGYKFE